jgi:hypothetical protein
MTSDRINPGGSMSKNKNVVEMHGCIVCAKSINILAVYTPDGRLVDCTVTSFGGHCVSGVGQPLVTCDSHTAEEIETAIQRWHSRNATELDDEQEVEKTELNGL